jgi:hypothetical protein
VLENQIEKTNALWETLLKPQVKVPSGEWSMSELSSTDREEPGKRNSRAEMRKSRWIEVSRSREVERASIFAAGLRH